MWTLEEPWLQIIARACFVFFFCFGVLRIWGKKHLGELSPFDFVLLLIMSEALQNSLIGDDKSVGGGLISFATLVLLNTVLNKLAFRSKKVEQVFEGGPEVLISDGKVDQAMLNKIHITQQELLEALREQGVMSPEDVYRGTLETNGKISVIKKEDKMPSKDDFH